MPQHLHIPTPARQGLAGSLALLILASWLAGCQAPAARPLAPLVVSVERLERRGVPETIDTLSSLEAPEEVSLAAQAGGRILSLRIRQGDTVRRGQLLVVLDQTQLREEVMALRGEREESFLNYRRFEYLARQGAASVIQRDAQRQNYVAAQAKLKAREADLAYKDLRAPIDGVVSDVSVKAGDVIQAGTPFTTIQRSSRLLARVEVPARYGARLRPGQAVRLIPPAGQSTIAGEVVSVDPRVNAASQTVLAKASVANPAGVFRTGERVRSQLLIGSQPQLTIPALAMTRISGQPFVFVVGSLADLRSGPGGAVLPPMGQVPPGTRFALQRPVRLGSLQGARYPVFKGLEPGEMLITSNLISLRHGTPVSVP